MSSPLGWLRNILGQLIVSMFFFTSGYGIILSVENKGALYAKSIATNRLLRIILYSVASIIPFFIYCAALGKEHVTSDYFLAIVGLVSFGNSAWFLFAILICYYISTIVFLFNYRHDLQPILLIAMGAVYYVFIMVFADKPFWTWDTIVCFPYGALIGHYRKKVDSLLSKNKIIPHVILFVSVAIVIVSQHIVNSKNAIYFPKLIEMFVANFFFCMIFVCLTKVYTLKSPVLGYIGKISFAIFYMHQIVLGCFKEVGTIPNKSWNYFVLFTTAIAIGVPYYYVYKLIDKYMVDPVVKWNRDLIVKNPDQVSML